ncbi:MAG: transposase [bacterium]|nr:transposase [bacterium]
MRKITFEVGEYYHAYNRGVDKRNIVQEEYDSERFLQALIEFNVVEPIGSIYENSFRKDQLGSLASKSEKLVNVVCYCLNPNHFHLLLEQIVEKGIERFLHKLSTGHAKYFNKKYKRSGSLFEGTFKAKHVSSNDYLQYLSAYINLNNRVHQIEGEVSKLVRSSWEEYLGNKEPICHKDIVLDQFSSAKEYARYCMETLPILIENKALAKELQNLGFEE